ncbi:MAG: class I SAM-dependent methyltransferase [Dehalococcoidia bacterium]
MKQNKYDEPGFFAKYSEMPRSVGGLDEAGEWPAFRELLPDLRGRRVLDLGCGFGWHCRYALQQGARMVTGADISEKMIERARATTDDPRIEYRLSAIEDIGFPPDEFDVVISSLALHYVERFDLVCREVHRCMAAGGVFVLSVEHPLFTARAAQQWCYGPEGERLHWPVDNYQQEGARHTRWMADDVIKYHRTVATYLNTLIESGFNITRVSEPAPSPEMLSRHPDWIDEDRRPMFLLMAAARAAMP